MGDSQMQRLKPDKFDLKTYNLASSAEHYYFTYQKLKKIVDFKNHEIKQIILGVSAHNFAPVYCRFFNIKYPEGKSSFSRYLYFINLTNNEFIRIEEILSKSLIEGIYKGPDWGGLQISNKKNPDISIINQMFKEHYEIKYKESLYSSEQIKYLSFIDSLCNDHNIDLILVSTPYCPQYIINVDQSYFNILEKTVDRMVSAKYVSYIDPEINPELMSDAVHLNSDGADIFSKMINDTINAMSK